MKTLAMMKLKSGLLAVVLVAALFTFAACDNGNDDYLPPNQEIIDALNKLYPTVQNIEWSQKGAYYVADCWVDGNELDVWFDANANWVMTEDEIRIEQVPAAVYTAFQESSYGSWVIDDLTLITYPTQPAEFIFEVQNGDQEKALYFSEYGSLIREIDITDADFTHWPNVPVP